MATRASRARATTGGRGSTTRARVGRTRDRRGRPARGAGRANANANANANAKKTDEGAKRTAKDAMEGLRPARARVSMRAVEGAPSRDVSTAPSEAGSHTELVVVQGAPWSRGEDENELPEAHAPSE